MALADGLSWIAGAAILIAVGLAILVSIDHVADFTRRIGAYYALMLLAATGMLAMVTASDFMTIFLGLEIFSLALYILVGYYRNDLRSGEAALKYFLLGAFASGFFLYGIALIYGATGQTNLAAITMSIAPQSSSLPFAPLLPIGIGLLLVGFGFKVAMVPFHMWTPDVYQGAPTTVTAFMSVATKTAVFAALIRVLASFTTVSQPWLMALAVLAALTMTLGNLAALRQTSVKRMLAYSSIAHAGYILTGLAAGTAQGAEAALYYLVVYTFMTFGAFGVVLAAQRRDENDLTTAADRRAGFARTVPCGADVHLHVCPDRDSAAGRFLREAVRVRRGSECRADLVGRHRGDQQRHRGLLLSADYRLDVHGCAGRRMPKARVCCGAQHLCAGAYRARCGGCRHGDPGPVATTARQWDHPGGRISRSIKRSTISPQPTTKEPANRQAL